MNTIDRIFQYLDFKGYKYAPTEKILGLSNGYLGKMRARGASIGSEVVEKIVQSYRDINPEWLLTGDGEMLRGHVASNNTKNVKELPSGPCKQCELRDMIIAKQEDSIELLKDKISQLHKQLKDKPDDIRQTG
jgi:hypothetical protein